MDPVEVDEVVNRVIGVLRHFTLLKREVDWYRCEEPGEYLALRKKLAEAIRGPNDPNRQP